MLEATVRVDADGMDAGVAGPRDESDDVQRPIGYEDGDADEGDFEEDEDFLDDLDDDEDDEFFDDDEDEEEEEFVEDDDGELFGEDDEPDVDE